MRRTIRIPLLTLALSVLFAGTVLATVGAGFHQTIESRGTVNGRVHTRSATVELESQGSIDIVTATLTIDPLATSGWHSHPGVVLVTVVSGSLTFYDRHCRARVQDAGSAFIESGNSAGLVRNLSATTAAVVNATFVVPAGTPNTGLRIDKANPGCPQS
jgi:quercetin dioxygenase-like cupin family protein